MATITCHDARQHDKFCDVCGKEHQNVVEITEGKEGTALAYGGIEWYICEVCIHVMYAKCCAAFNVRPAKLW